MDGTGQAIGKLRLAGQNNLHQFCPGSFEVGEQADGLENFFVQILRFVNHQHEAAPRTHLFGKQAVQACHAWREDPYPRRQRQDRA